MKLNFPFYATSVIQTIESNGFEAWFVGGCVRDSIIGREFYDIDITTNALPEDIEAIFPLTVPTGKKHGTITVLAEGHPIEVTTYRSETGYSDNRHPNNVSFKKNIEEDLSRRDFTINALAYHPKRELLDIFGGISDLKNGIICAVGNPEKRFCEDALRILRAFRFASVLNFKIEEETYNSAILCSDRLSSLSGERVLSELKKLSNGQKPYIINTVLENNGLIDFGIGSLRHNPPPLDDVLEEFKTAFFIFLCNNNLKLIKDKLKPGKKLLKNINMLNEISKINTPNNKTELKLILNSIDGFKDLYLEYVKLFESDEIYINVKNLLNEIEEQKEPYLIRDLKINGHDLEELGITGHDIKDTLERLIVEVIEDPKLNTVYRLKKLINK